MQKPHWLAVLTDMGPLEPRLFGRVLARAATYGPVTVRRVYGNCDKLRRWKDCLQYRDIEPRANYGDGANAADITLIIDAVHLLLSGRVDGFCIVASDHHFTGLVRWLRDNDVFVAGIGRPNASPGLQAAFGDHYTDIGDLPEPDGAYGKAERDLAKRIRGAIEGSPKSPDGYANLNMVNDRLDDLDARAYCHGGLASLIGSYGEFEVRGGIYARIRPPPE